MISLALYSKKREFAGPKRECMPCHQECATQDGKHTCTGPVCNLLFSDRMPFTVCTDCLIYSFSSCRVLMSVQPVCICRTGRTVCPRVQRGSRGRMGSSFISSPTASTSANHAMPTAPWGEEAQNVQ